MPRHLLRAVCGLRLEHRPRSPGHDPPLAVGDTLNGGFPVVGLPDPSQLGPLAGTVDDKFGFCPGCREMGIKLEGLKTCPKCGREFKYVTAHDSKGPKGFEMVGRIRKKLPHLAFVDYDDYERISGKKKAESLFNV